MYEHAFEAAEYLKKVMKHKADIAVVLGSGLGSFAEDLVDPVHIPYDSIPHFATSTAPGHEGRMVFGRINDKNILCMQGRVHYFEGYSMQKVTFYVRVLKLLDIPYLLITNASGGIDVNYVPGDIMLVTDHINFMGYNPLIGPNDPRFGDRFVDMTFAYDTQFREKIKLVASKLQIEIKEGVYVGFMGPSYETPAEIRMFRSFGASAVGMSTVPEVIEANHCGIPVAVLACITNMAAGILDQRLCGNEVIATGQKMRSHFGALLREIIELL